MQESQGEPSESIASGFVSKKRRRVAKPKDKIRTNEARDRCRRLSFTGLKVIAGST